MTKKIIVVIEGVDADTAFAELLANAQYDKLDCTIWTFDNPADVEGFDTSLCYMPEDNAQDDVDEAYERAAEHARNNDFEDTGGKDWT